MFVLIGLMANEKSQDDDDIFEDDDDYSYGNKENSEANIVLSQFRKCVLEGSKEMVLGGVTKRIINNEVIEFPVPNQIEIFINSIEMLKIVLSKSIKDYKDNKEIKECYDKFDEGIKQIEKVKQELIKNITNNQARNQNVYLINSNSRKKGFEDVAIINSIQDIEQLTQRLRVDAYKNLLESISLIIKDLNYFGIEEVIG